MEEEQFYPTLKKEDGTPFTLLSRRSNLKFDRDPAEVSLQDKDFLSWLTKIALLRKWVLESAYILDEPDPPCFICPCPYRKHHEQCMYTRCQRAFENERGVCVWWKHLEFLYTGDCDYQLFFSMNHIAERVYTPTGLGRWIYEAFDSLAQFCLDIDNIWGKCELSGEMSHKQLERYLDLGHEEYSDMYRSDGVPLIFYKGLFRLKDQSPPQLTNQTPCLALYMDN
jgi:hypothetical protein